MKQYSRMDDDIFMLSMLNVRFTEQIIFPIELTHDLSAYENPIPLDHLFDQLND